MGMNYKKIFHEVSKKLPMAKPLLSNSTIIYQDHIFNSSLVTYKTKGLNNNNHKLPTTQLKEFFYSHNALSFNILNTKRSSLSTYFFIYKNNLIVLNTFNYLCPP